jgi:hypothetical protein
MEVGKKTKIFLYFWLPSGTNNKNLLIGGILFYFQNLANLGHFFQ